MINAWLGEWSDALPAPKYSIIRANNKNPYLGSYIGRCLTHHVIIFDWGQGTMILSGFNRQTFWASLLRSALHSILCIRYLQQVENLCTILLYSLHETFPAVGPINSA